MKYYFLFAAFFFLLSNFGGGGFYCNKQKLHDADLEIKEILKEKLSAIKADTSYADNSLIIDTLYRNSLEYPDKHSAFLILGYLCLEKNFQYDAYLFLEKYLSFNDSSQYHDEAVKTLFMLNSKIDTSDLEYCRFIKKYLTAISKKKGLTNAFWKEGLINKYGPNIDRYFWNNMYEETFEAVLFQPILGIKGQYNYKEITVGKFKYCIIKSGNKLELSSPIFEITGKWPEKESGQFIFHAQAAEELPDDLCCKKLDDFCSRMKDIFSVKDSVKIDYYICSNELNGVFYFKPPALGYAAPGWKIVSSSICDNYHEITHVIANAKINFGNSFFEEGLAACYGGTSFFGASFIPSWIRDMYMLNKLPHISEILSDAGFRSKKYDVNNNYFLAGCFTKFLIETYGAEKFIAINNGAPLISSDDRFLSVYKKNLAALEIEFHKWLDNLNIPEITPSFNESAEELFSMRDKSNDDNGCGTFVYPDDSACGEGILDLLKFRALEDSANYNFELTFRNLVNNDSAEWGFYRTFAEIFIKNQNYKNRNIFLYPENINLQSRFDYAIHVSDKGIELENFEDSQIISMKLFKTSNKVLGDIENKRIRFSVSKKIMAGLTKESGFFVGIGAGDISDGFQKYSGSFVGRPAGITAVPNKNNGGCGYESACVPVFYDILLKDNVEQDKLLSKFSCQKGEYVILPFIYR